jgi:hypothetical protein
MAKFKVIEGTVWLVEADSLEAAKATYEAHFNGDETASEAMQEVEGSSHWFGQVEEDDEMKSTTFYSECECGQELEGTGTYHPQEGTLYADENCPACGEEFSVGNWFEKCDECDECHPDDECELDEEGE